MPGQKYVWALPCIWAWVRAGKGVTERIYRLKKDAVADCEECAYIHEWVCPRGIPEPEWGAIRLKEPVELTGFDRNDLDM